MELIINLSEQWLELRGTRTERFAISSAANGAGEAMGSGATPRGAHVVRARFGAGLPPGAVLLGRKFSGEVFDAELGARFPERDWVLSRTLWLFGLEPGQNPGATVATFRRFFYIHGTPGSYTLGQPAFPRCNRSRTCGGC